MRAQSIAIVCFIFSLTGQSQCAQIDSTSDENQSPNVDDIVQQYVERVPKLIKDLGFDPAPIPNAERILEGFWFTLGTGIKFDLWNGTSNGLSNFTTIGKFSIENQNTTVLISGKLLFPELKSNCTSWARTYFRDVSKTVDTTLQNVTLAVNITTTAIQPIQIMKVDLRIIEIGSTDIDLNEESDSVIHKYFTNSIKPRFMVLMPGVIQESADGVSKNAILEINKVLPDLHEQILQNAMKKKLGKL